MNNAIVPLDVNSAVDRVKVLALIVRELRDSVFIENQDYGKIPGTGDKPVLLLPGMEKLMRALRLRAKYIPTPQTVIDFDRPLIFYEFECELTEIDTGVVIASALGNANSYEGKWRWRKAERVCPACGQATIIKGKAEYGGGWLCFQKKGGCGAKYGDNDPAIVNQEVGRVENPDIFDQLNTICKIAQKRALGSAIKGAANVSEFFTVDLEDIPQMTLSKPLPSDAIDADFEDVTPPNQPRPQAQPQQQQAQNAPAPAVAPANAVGAYTDQSAAWAVVKRDALEHAQFDNEFHLDGTIRKGLAEEWLTEDMTVAQAIAALDRYSRVRAIRKTAFKQVEKLYPAKTVDARWTAFVNHTDRLIGEGKLAENADAPTIASAVKFDVLGELA